MKANVTVSELLRIISENNSSPSDRCIFQKISGPFERFNAVGINARCSIKINQETKQPALYLYKANGNGLLHEDKFVDFLVTECRSKASALTGDSKVYFDDKLIKKAGYKDILMFGHCLVLAT